MNIDGGLLLIDNDSFGHGEAEKIVFLKKDFCIGVQHAPGKGDVVSAVSVALYSTVLEMERQPF